MPSLFKKFFIAALLVTPLFAFASAIGTQQGGTGSSSPSGILFGNNNATPLSTLTIGSGLTLTGTTLSATGGSSASSTLLGDTNTFSGTDTFSNTIGGSISGNASTATTLQNARTINGVSFNGSANIVVASTTLLGDSNTFSGALDIFSNTLKVASLSGFIGGNGGTLYNFATSTIKTSQLTNDAGFLTSAVTSVGATYPLSSSGGATPTISTAFGTTSNTGIAAGSLYIGSGGIFQSTATTTASCTGNASCSAFTIFGTSPVTINVAAGTAASSTLLTDANTFSGVDKFTNASSDFSGTWQTFSPAHFLTAAITALGPTGQTQTGATQTLATSSATTISGLTVGLTIVGNTNTQTFTPTFTGSISGLTTSNFSSANISQWTNNSNYITLASLSGSYPVTYNSGTGAIGFSGLATTSPWTQGQLAYVVNNNTITSTPTTTVTCTGSASCTSFVALGSSPISINVAAGTAASSTLLGDTNTFSGTDSFTHNITTLGISGLTGNTLTISPASGRTLALQNNGGTGVIDIFNSGVVAVLPATSLGFEIADPGGSDAIFDTSHLSTNQTYAFPNVTGTFGIGVSTTSGQLAYWGGDAGLRSAATTSVTCTGSASCTGFTALGSSPVTINVSAGTAASFPFTPLTTFGVNTSATTTPIWAEAGIFASSTSQIASTTFSLNGNVGIGSTTPFAKLEIFAASSTQLVIRGDSNQASSTPAFIIQHPNGSSAIEFRTGGQGQANEFIGKDVGSQITTGTDNTGVGNGALKVFQIGSGNNFFGSDAGFQLVDGQFNEGFGKGALGALRNNSNDNIGIGDNVLGAGSLDSTNGNVAIGTDALFTTLTLANYNVAIGFDAMRNLSNGEYNISVGQHTGVANPYGSQQLDIGNVLFGTGMYNGTSNSSLPVATGSIGLGTSSLAANFFIQNDYGATNPNLFLIASSTSVTGDAVTNLFSISNTGSIFTQLATGCIQSTAGVLSSTGSSCGTGGGGTGVGTVSTSSLETAGKLPYWTTTSGYPAKLGSVATTTLSGGGPITVSNAPVVIGASGAVLGCTTAASGVAGCLSNTAFDTFNGKENVLTFATPNIRTGNTINWVGLATTSQPSSSNLLTSNGGAGVYGTATSTLSATGPLTGSFTQVGSGGSLGCTTAASGVAGCLSNTAFDIFNNKQAALSTPTWPIKLTGTTLSFGWATTSQPSSSNLFVSDGASGFYGVATGTVSAGSSAITVTAGRAAIGGALAIDCATAGSGQNGCLSSTDWSTFNGKDSFAWPFTATTFGSGVISAATSSVLYPSGLVTGTSTIGALVASSSITNQAVKSALVLDSATGLEGAYAGSNPCTNQVALSLSATGVISCTSVTNAMLSNSTISGVALGGTLAALSHDTSLTGTSYTGTSAVSDWGLNLGHGNTWTALQQFSNASSSLLSVYNTAYFGTTATTTIDGTGNIVIPSGSNLTVAGKGDGCATFASGVLNSTGSGCGGSASAAGNTNAVQYNSGSSVFAGSDSFVWLNSTHNLGIGSTTPFATLGVHAQNGDTNTTLFAIASSTASATTTLFSVSNTGTITLGTGATRTFKMQDQPTTNTGANQLNIRGGLGNGSGAGGALDMRGGNGGTTGSGGNLIIDSGNAGTGGNGSGGSIFLTGGDAAGSGTGGSFTLGAGIGGGTGGTGGSATVQGGLAGSSGGNGGAVSLLAGAADTGSNSNGGSVAITAMAGAQSGNGGSVTITAGKAGNNGGNASGNITLLAGDNNGAGGTQGAIFFKDPASLIQAKFDTSGLATSNKTFTFPNTTGTFALGTGATNNVSYWSNANTLTSNSNFAFDGSNLSVGTSTAQALLQVSALFGTLPANGFIFAVASSTRTATTTLFGVAGNGHLIASSTTATVGTCGTSPTVLGDDTTGEITVGTGLVSACTLTFAYTWTNTPHCFVGFNIAAATSTLIFPNITTSSIVINATSTKGALTNQLGGSKIDYWCTQDR